MPRKPKAAQRTVIAAILDKSGSMQPLVHDTIGGFNQFLVDQQALPGEALLGVTQFDTECEVGAPEPIAQVRPLTTETYCPGGNTALLDAVHKAIRGAEPHVRPTDRVLVLIITDGQENSSREVKLEAVRALIQEKTATGRWTFTYLGANQDSWAEASLYGISMGNAANYTATGTGTRQAFANVSASTANYRSAPAAATPDFYAGAGTLPGVDANGTKLPKRRRSKAITV